MNKKLYYQILLYPIVMILIVAISLISCYTYQHNKNFKNLKQDLLLRFENHNKQTTKDKVDIVIKRFQVQQLDLEAQLKKKIKRKVDSINTILNNLYKKYHKILSKNEMQELLVNTVESYSFEDSDNFFFLTDLNTNKIISHKKIPNLVGKDMTKHTDSNGLNLLT